MRTNFKNNSAKVEHNRLLNQWKKDFTNSPARTLSADERKELEAKYSPPGTRFEIWEKKNMDKVFDELKMGE